MAKMVIGDPSSVELLPKFMRDDGANVGIARAIDELIADPGSRTKTLRIWDQVDNLDHETLNELAWELNIDWYEDSWPIETKRETIKTAKLIQEHRGTVWAIEQVVKNTFGDGKVIEWWEYGGKPYHFKVTTEYPLYNQDLIDKFIQQVNIAKRPDTILDAVEYAFIGTANNYMYTAAQAQSITYASAAN